MDEWVDGCVGVWIDKEFLGNKTVNLFILFIWIVYFEN